MLPLGGGAFRRAGGLAVGRPAGTPTGQQAHRRGHGPGTWQIGICPSASASYGSRLLLYTMWGRTSMRNRIPGNSGLSLGRDIPTGRGGGGAQCHGKMPAWPICLGAARLHLWHGATPQKTRARPAGQNLTPHKRTRKPGLPRPPMEKPKGPHLLSGGLFPNPLARRLRNASAGSARIPAAARLGSAGPR